MVSRLHIPPVAIIVAVDEEGGFAKDGKIPWHFPEDFKHFKEITDGNPCIMGRNTYEEILEMRKARMKGKGKKKKKKIKQLLPNRECFVLSTDPKFEAEGAKTARTLRDAIEYLDAKDNRRVFILGGQGLYMEALNWTDTIFMTIIKNRYQCDTFFPIEVLNKDYRIVDGSQNDNMYFVTYKKNKKEKSRDVPPRNFR